MYLGRGVRKNIYIREGRGFFVCFGLRNRIPLLGKNGPQMRNTILFKGNFI